jgi:SAM-dependent methyltransferase
MSAIQHSTAEPRTAPLHECPLCGSSDHRKLFSSIDRLHGVPGTYSYDKCADCRSVFQNPMVIEEDLHLCYPKEYEPYDFDPEMPDVRFDEAGERSFRERLRRDIVHAVWNEPSSTVGRVFSKSRWMRERAFYGMVPDECLPDERDKYYALDVGCGSGWMLKRLAKVGWKAEGIEWDESAAELARQRTGANVWTGDFRHIDLEKGNYSLIFLSHVFEHFRDPQGALERFFEVLDAKGKLVMVFPNPEAFDARWFKNKWFAWEVPRHLILPAQKILPKMAKNAGFSSCSVTSRTARHYWTKSLAYQVSRHPERDEPGLGLQQAAGFAFQRFGINLGMGFGSESIVVLKK